MAEDPVRARVVSLVALVAVVSFAVGGGSAAGSARGGDDERLISECPMADDGELVTLAECDARARAAFDQRVRNQQRWWTFESVQRLDARRLKRVQTEPCVGLRYERLRDAVAGAEFAVLGRVQRLDGYSAAGTRTVLQVERTAKGDAPGIITFVQAGSPEPAGEFQAGPDLTGREPAVLAVPEWNPFLLPGDRVVLLLEHDVTVNNILIPVPYSGTYLIKDGRAQVPDAVNLRGGKNTFGRIDGWTPKRLMDRIEALAAR